MSRLAFCLALLLAGRHPGLPTSLVRFALAVLVHLPGLIVPLLSLATAGLLMTVAVLVVLIAREFGGFPFHFASAFR